MSTLCRDLTAPERLLFQEEGTFIFSKKIDKVEKRDPGRTTEGTCVLTRF